MACQETGLTLNNTVANLAERLANTEGKHAFSFTPEADTVAQKWKSTMSDFSVMLRQSYDGTKYEREARSADAVNVHIDKLLWNVTMCGTPDALYRVVNNYTDGFQSRIAVARTPDNTFAPLEDKPFVLRWFPESYRRGPHPRQYLCTVGRQTLRTDWPPARTHPADCPPLALDVW